MTKKLNQSTDFRSSSRDDERKYKDRYPEDDGKERSVSHEDDKASSKEPRDEVCFCRELHCHVAFSDRRTSIPEMTETIDLQMTPRFLLVLDYFAEE